MSSVSRSIAVFARPGIASEGAIPDVMHPMQPIPVSASEIRARVGARRGRLGALVPAAVANYIARHRLYS